MQDIHKKINLVSVPIRGFFNLTTELLANAHKLSEGEFPSPLGDSLI